MPPAPPSTGPEQEKNNVIFIPLRHGGDRVAEALRVHGVRSLFTLCGGHISPILSAAKARGIRIVDVRDEATAVFAADATARLSGMPGVAAVTAGPGITNTITALKNAQLAQSPVILLGGAAPTALQGRGALQDIDQRPAGGAARQAVSQDHEGARPRAGRRGSLRRGALRRARAGVRRVPGRPAVRRSLDSPVVCRRGRQRHERRPTGCCAST